MAAGLTLLGIFDTLSSTSSTLDWFKENYERFPSPHTEEKFDEKKIKYISLWEFEKPEFKTSVDEVVGSEAVCTEGFMTITEQGALANQKKVQFSIEQSSLDGTGAGLFLTLTEEMGKDEFLGVYGGIVGEDKGTVKPYSVLIP